MSQRHNDPFTMGDPFPTPSKKLNVLYWYGKTDIMKAKLIYAHKAEIKERFIVELTIHEVGQSKKYRDGIKYSLICFDKKTGRKVLMDNHHPKGHHLHLDDTELPYVFLSDEKLIRDFEKLVLDHMGIKL